MLAKLATLDEAMDRAIGSMVGLAVGDSVGAPLEFIGAVDSGTGASRVDIATLTYQNACNRFDLRAGQWTDDTAMSLCLADSLLVSNGKLDGTDLRERFWSWWFQGYNNAFRKQCRERVGSVGLGGNISKSLYSMKVGLRPTPEYEAQGSDAGNGSIMRLAPIAVAHCAATTAAQLSDARAIAAASSRSTHPGTIAAEACAFLAHLLIMAITRFEPGPPGAARAFLFATADEYIENVLMPRAPKAAGSGRGKGEGEGEDNGEGVVVMLRLLASNEPSGSLERMWNWRKDSLDIAGTMLARGPTYNGYPNTAEYLGSYAPDALAIALHAIANTDSFDSAVERCVNTLGDADSHGAVCGQIAGAMYGWRAIGPHLRAALNEWDDAEIGLRAALLVHTARAREAENSSAV